ncbi:hypothetical protein HDU81_000477 [Chytriomyces hyalinus]|nr:hypothetical protein HDU81_000477 [Chytriomyces hyalinus]
MNHFPPIVDRTSGSIAPAWLLSFDASKFVLFCFVTIAIAYPLYRTVGVLYLGWEGHRKSPAKHFNDILVSINYALPLFVFGNYSNTINWIMAVSFFVSLGGFGWLAEAPFLRHSFVTVKNWGAGMYITIILAVGAIVGALGYHLYLAYTFRLILGDGTEATILGWYLVGILIPVSLITTAWLVCVAQNLSKPVISFGFPGNEATLGSKWERVSLHPHHWAIFYSIAYFTRFDNVASNIAAGIVLGMYMHGIAAYGHDELLERHS